MATTAPRPAKGLEKESAQRLIVVLERASLETVKAGQSFQLLNSDDHAHILKKNNKNAAEYRPPSPLITNRLLVLNMTLQVPTPRRAVGAST